MVVIRPSLTICPIEVGKISIRKKKVCKMESATTTRNWLTRSHLWPQKDLGERASRLTFGVDLEVHNNGVAEDLDKASDVA